jgi:hypothetical protein
MYHGYQNLFRHTRWYFYMTLAKWKLILVYLEILLILTQARCTICVKCTIGSKIALGTPKDTPR